MTRTLAKHCFRKTFDGFELKHSFAVVKWDDGSSAMKTNLGRLKIFCPFGSCGIGKVH